MRQPLEKLYDLITPSDSSSPFVSAETSPVLDRVWAASKASKTMSHPVTQVGRIRDIVQGRGTISVRPPGTRHSHASDLQPAHPLSFFPALLVVLNPLIVTVYRYAVAGKRIVSNAALSHE